MKTIKYLLLAMLLVGQVSCVDKKFEDEFKITISPDAVVNKINVQLIDLTTFRPVDATITFTGDNAKYVYNEAGKREEVSGGYQIDAEEGIASFGIERKANASESNPVPVTVTISAPGYQDHVLEIEFDGADEAQSYPVGLLPSVPVLAPRVGKANKVTGVLAEDCEVPDDAVLFSFTNTSLVAVLYYEVKSIDGTSVIAQGLLAAPQGTFTITGATLKYNPFFAALRPLLDAELKLTVTKIDFLTFTAESIFSDKTISLCTIVEDSTPVEDEVPSEPTATYNLDLTIECDAYIELDGYDVQYRKVGESNFRYFQTIKKGFIKGEGPVLEANSTYQFRIKYDGQFRTTPESGENAVKGSDVVDTIDLNQEGICDEVNDVI